MDMFGGLSFNHSMVQPGIFNVTDQNHRGKARGWGNVTGVWQKWFSSIIPGRKHCPNHMWQSLRIWDMHGHLLAAIHLVDQHSFYYQKAGSLQKTISGNAMVYSKHCPSPKFILLYFSFPFENCECQLFPSLKTIIIKLVSLLVSSNPSHASWSFPLQKHTKALSSFSLLA